MRVRSDGFKLHGAATCQPALHDAAVLVIFALCLTCNLSLRHNNCIEASFDFSALCVV